VAGSNNFDMEDMSIVFFPATPELYNVSCTHDISELGFPEDIDAGSTRRLRDDSSRRVFFGVRIHS
jgi:hypothetical protein